MGWKRCLPALTGWSAVAVLVVAAAATTPGATRAELVRPADPAGESPLWTVTATFPVRATNPAAEPPTARPSATTPPDAPPTTTTASSGAPPAGAPQAGVTTAVSTTTAPTVPVRVVDGVVSSGRAPARSPACSSPSGGGAVFRQPCAGAAVGLWQRVELDVGELPDDGAVALVLRTSTDRDGAPAPARDVLVGWADEPGRWSLVVRIGARCADDRTGAELRAYLFPARDWTSLAGPELGGPELAGSGLAASGQAVSGQAGSDLAGSGLAGGFVVPPDSGLLDRVPVTRADQVPDCEDHR
ncbi:MULTISPECIES: hypothetical protein [Actinosynnema]|uniref:hypothetical protein n=1 Tax=Actinosynnema TaxID=40566 RepID=UPI002646C89C|nr:hypothetical protein [Actinosynnema pretiosum]MCP2095027.1 hypothetical protein [Actinosynnema pretiosum]